MITRRGLLKGLLGGIGLAVLAPVTSAIPSIKSKVDQGHASREHVLHIMAIMSNWISVTSEGISDTFSPFELGAFAITFFCGLGILVVAFLAWKNL